MTKFRLQEAISHPTTRNPGYRLGPALTYDVIPPEANIGPIEALNQAMTPPLWPGGQRLCGCKIPAWDNAALTTF